MADRKNRFALISKFEQMCRINGYQKPALNKHKEQWAADSILESWDDPDIYKAMEYYFKINKNPSWNGFVNNVDGLLESLRQQEADAKFRADMREKAKAWLT